MQRSFSSGRRWLWWLPTLLFVLVTIAALVDILVWFRLERALDRRVTAFTQAAARSGWSVQAHRGRRGGWPFAASLRVSGLRVAADHGAWPARLEWSGDIVDLSLSPFRPDMLHVALPGTQSLQIGTLSLRGWGNGLGLDSDGARIVLRADALHLVQAGAGPDDVLQSAAAIAELHWRPDQPGGTDVAVTLHAVAMPLLGGGEGRIAERARLVLALDAPLTAALNESAAGTPSFTAMLGRWARDGGAFRLQEASLDWADAGLFLSGRASPDGDGRLNGALSLDMTRPDRPLSVLRRAGVIGTGQETAMLAVIGLVGDGQPAGPDDPQRIRLPIELRDGVMRLGTIPLMTLPRL